MEVRDYRKVAYTLILVGVVAGVFFFLLFLSTSSPWLPYAPIDTEEFAKYGELSSGTVGVLFSLVGIFLLIQNLIDQNTNFIRKQVESTFFELLKIQRENSTAVVLKKIKGKKVFIFVIHKSRNYRENID